MDFITDLPPSKRKDHVYNSVLVIVDRLTKMARYLPTNKTCNVADLADMFMDEIVAHFGFPNGIVLDHGSVFTSTFWSELCYICKIKRRLSSAFHPQIDRQTERQNQTLEHYLQTYADEKQANWAALLPLAEFSYNNSKHSSTGLSPFMYMYGFDPKMHLDMAAKDGAPGGRVPAAKERIDKMHKLRAEAADRWQTVADQQKRAYNKKHAPKSFNVGDMVLLSTKNLKLRQPSRKLTHRYIGPFQITDAIGPQAYQLLLPNGYRIHPVFHVSLLEPYVHQQGDETTTLPPPEIINDEEQWEIEAIEDRTKHKGKLWYKVK